MRLPAGAQSGLPGPDRPTGDAALARGIAREMGAARDALG
jgi:hypothetical protein